MSPGLFMGVSEYMLPKIINGKQCDIIPLFFMFYDLQKPNEGFVFGVCLLDRLCIDLR